MKQNNDWEKGLRGEIKLIIAQSAPFDLIKFWDRADFEWLENKTIELLRRQRKQAISDERERILWKVRELPVTDEMCEEISDIVMGEIINQE